MEKTVYILRGIQGSGKTTFALQLMGEDRRGWCSADHYFERGGAYAFDPRLLGQAHNACYLKFMRSVETFVPVIVVDNTNARTSDYEHYVSYARKHGYTVRIIKLVPDHPMTAYKRNTHGVPLHAVINTHTTILKNADEREEVMYEWNSCEA